MVTLPPLELRSGYAPAPRRCPVRSMSNDEDDYEGSIQRIKFSAKKFDPGRPLWFSESQSDEAIGQ